jgi:hypothetical protein
MVEKKEIFVWQNILNFFNDAMCHVLIAHVNILVCIVVANVIAGTHPWICIKSPYSYSTKKNSSIVCSSQLFETCHLLLC